MVGAWKNSLESPWCNHILFGFCPTMFEKSTKARTRLDKYPSCAMQSSLSAHSSLQCSIYRCLCWLATETGATSARKRNGGGAGAGGALELLSNGPIQSNTCSLFTAWPSIHFSKICPRSSLLAVVVLTPSHYLEPLGVFSDDKIQLLGVASLHL